MSDRITRKDVERAVEQYRATGIGVGVLTEAEAELITLQTGSPTNGRAWRLFLRDPSTGALRAAPAVGAGLFSEGYIGWTAREAHAYLSAVVRAWWAVATREGGE